MTRENPELRAKPVEAKDLQKASPEELKKIREQAEADSGVKRNLEDPKYVTALNRGWAKHYGDSHPLSKKVLEFKQDGDHQKAVDAVKSIQRQLGLEEDGVIAYKTIKAYNEMLEKSTTPEGNLDLGKNNSFGIESDLQSIDALGKKEKQEKLKTHSEDLVKKIESGETEGLTDVNGQPLDSSSTVEDIRGTGENSDKYYNRDTGEYETKEERTNRIKTQDTEKASKRTERLSELKKIGEEGTTYGTDFEGQSIVYSADKKVWEATGGEHAGKTLNLETGEFETKKEKQETTTSEKKPEGEKTSPEEVTKIEGVLNKGEDPKTIGGAYNYELKGSILSRTDDTNGTVETWNEKGQVWETEDAKKEKEMIKEREQSDTQQKSIASIDTSALDAAADKGIFGIGKSLRETPITDVENLKPKNGMKGWGENSQLSEEQVKALQNIDRTGLDPKMTVGEYVDLMRDPIKAAGTLAQKSDKPQKLPGGLGEYGVLYQKNEQGEVLTYREGSEIPKIVQNGKEVDIQEYFGDRVLERLPLGNGREIVFTKNEGGKKEYTLREEKDGKVATRKIKEDGTLENVSEGTLIAATE